MTLKATHPEYAATVDDQILMSDAYKGERVVKEKDVTYLPPTPAMLLDGMETGKPGRKVYESYKTRAIFPDVVSEAVEHMIGLLHKKPAKFELPKAMEPLLSRATSTGEGLAALLRRVNEQQLVPGRLGLLVDMPTNPDPANPLPFIAVYQSTAVTNWDTAKEDVEKLQVVVLNEDTHVMDYSNFSWKLEERHRVLAFDPATGKYAQALFKDQAKTYDPSQLKSPTLRGKALEQIPFVFVNTKDLLTTPDNPPLLGLGHLAMAIYRGEADYRQALFMQGQDTLVIEGGIKAEDEETRVGAGATIEVDLGGDAKYIGVSSTGLPELRTSLENDYKRAETKTGQLINAMGGNKESGEALKTRVSAQTATLTQIAKTGAEALQTALRIMAEWMGLNPEEVIVTANTEFADITLTPEDLVKMMTAKRMGAPLSLESIHATLKERGMTKLEFDDELERIGEEDPMLGMPPPAPTGGPQPGAKPKQA